MSQTKKRAKAKQIEPIQWRTLAFWRNLLFYFLFFSYVGHYIEMAWTWAGHLILKTDLAHNILANPFEPYTIYGAGAVLCILLVEPIAKKFKDNIFATFAAGTIICGGLELVSSIVLTMRYGHNPYWNYDDRMFNLGGHICLGNCLAFGLLATVFLRLIYTPMEKILKKGNQIVINVMLAVLALMLVIYYLAPIVLQ